MSVTDVAIERIRELIASGRFEAGDRLPSETTLAAEFGVSRSSLREAIRALAQTRVLDVKRGDGTYVSSLDPAVLLSGLGFAVDLMQDSTLLETFEIRRMLEPVATGIAATKATAADIVALQTRLDAMRAAGTTDELISEDLLFHRQVVAITGNVTLGCLMEALASRQMRARIWRSILEDGVRSFTLEQHQRIVDAIASHDVTLATAASTVHVSASEAWLRRLLAAEGGDIEEIERAAADVQATAVGLNVEASAVDGAPTVPTAAGASA